VDSWKKKRVAEHNSDGQLQWEANVVQYVNFLWDCARVNRSGGKETNMTYLPKDIPLLGPCFIPPTYSQLERRQYGAANISPDLSYIKPINVIHPFYYPALTVCPKCQSKDVAWEGWTSTGSREVHGLQREETAIGYQLRCRSCEYEENGKQKGYCFATTNPTFWQNWQRWQIPREYSATPSCTDMTHMHTRRDSAVLQAMCAHARAI
jgi:hypothetical protein